MAAPTTPTSQRSPSRPRRGRDVGQPLSDRERASAESAGRRLRAELRRALQLLPAPAGASELARRLRVDRSICQRVLNACAPDAHELAVLCRAPGVSGLRRFLNAFARQGIKASETAGAVKSVDQYDQLIRRLARSQARLVRRIESTLAAEHSRSASIAGADQEQVRAELFNAAVAVTGREMDALVAIHIARPAPEDAATIQSVGVQGQIGVRLHPGGMPLVSSFISANWGERDRLRPVDAGALAGDLQIDERPAAVLIPEFSTHPLPMVERRDQHGCLMQVLDPDRALAGQTFDVVVGQRTRGPLQHPGAQGPPVIELYLTARQPARALVLDVYLDEELFKSAVPSLTAYLWSPNYDSQLHVRWYDMLPHGPKLQVLGRGLSGAATSAYGRHHELTAHLFNVLGWGADRFVGVRCEVTYPVWGGCYRIRFEY